MPPILRVPPSRVRQDIQTLIRTFGGTIVSIKRVTEGPTNEFGDTTPIERQVYRGEALFVPAGGSVEILGIGQVELKTPHLLISGSWPVQQGDEVVVEGRRFKVADNPDPWKAFLLLPLKQVEASAT